MRPTSTFVLAASLALLASQAGAAGVNCEQVKRYAQTGRTAEQIAETMIVDEEEVKKCLESADPAKPPPMSGSAPAGGSGAASGGGTDEP